MGTAFPGNTVSDHAAGKQVEDDVEIQVIVLNLEIGNVADPDFILPDGFESPIEQILFLVLLPLFVVALCVFPDADQVQLLHNLAGTLFTHMDAAFCQDNPNLFGAVPLFAVVKNLLHLQHQLPLLFQILRAIRFAENMVVEGPSRHIQGLT